MIVKIRTSSNKDFRHDVVPFVKSNMAIDIYMSKSSHMVVSKKRDIHQHYSFHVCSPMVMFLSINTMGHPQIAVVVSTPNRLVQADVWSKGPLTTWQTLETSKSEFRE